MQEWSPGGCHGADVRGDCESLGCTCARRGPRRLSRRPGGCAPRRTRAFRDQGRGGDDRCRWCDPDGAGTTPCYAPEDADARCSGPGPCGRFVNGADCHDNGCRWCSTLLVHGPAAGARDDDGRSPEHRDLHSPGDPPPEGCGTTERCDAFDYEVARDNGCSRDGRCQPQPCKVDCSIYVGREKRVRCAGCYFCDDACRSEGTMTSGAARSWRGVTTATAATFGGRCRPQVCTVRCPKYGDESTCVTAGALRGGCGRTDATADARTAPAPPRPRSWCDSIATAKSARVGRVLSVLQRANEDFKVFLCSDEDPRPGSTRRPRLRQYLRPLLRLRPLQGRPRANSCVRIGRAAQRPDACGVKTRLLPSGLASQRVTAIRATTTASKTPANRTAPRPKIAIGALRSAWGSETKRAMPIQIASGQRAPRGACRRAPVSASAYQRTAAAACTGAVTQTVTTPRRPRLPTVRARLFRRRPPGPLLAACVTVVATETTSAAAAGNATSTAACF